MRQGVRPGESDFPKVYMDAVTLEPTPTQATPFNRAWHAAGKLFKDEAKRISFYKRVEMMEPFLSGKYNKYVYRGEGGSMPWP